MSSEKYRLEKVLEMRARSKDSAARQVALQYERLARAEEELNRRQLNLRICYERQNQAQAAMLADLTKVSPAKNLLAHKNYLRDLRNAEAELLAAVEQQKQVVAKTEAEVETAREKLIEAARELKAIEIHKTNWQNAEIAVNRRREQKLSDEIGSILHGLRGKS